MPDKIEFYRHPTIIFIKLILKVNGKMQQNYYIEFDKRDLENGICIQAFHTIAEYNDLNLAKYDLIQRYYYDLEPKQNAI